MKTWIASISAVVAAAAAVFGPDAWVYLETQRELHQQEARLYAIESLGVRVESTVRANVYEMEEHLRDHNNDALLIASELENNRLLTEEYFQQLRREIHIESLEDQINDLVDSIAREQAELDRQMRIINGGSASGPTEETFRARDRAAANISSLEARMESRVRELNRLMLQ